MRCRKRQRQLHHEDTGYSRRVTALLIDGCTTGPSQPRGNRLHPRKT